MDIRNVLYCIAKRKAMEQAEQLPGLRSVRASHLAHAKPAEQEVQTRA